MKIELGNRVILEPRPEINARLRKLGGLTPNGLPWFRLVWGWSRMGYMGGWEYDCIRDSGGLPLTDFFGRALDLIIIQPTIRTPKYWPHFDRWYLEMWNPPERYGTPETWKAEFAVMVPDHDQMGVRGPNLPAGTVIETLGPYPDRGDYEIAMAFQELPGEQLGGLSVIKAMEFAQRARSMTDAFRFATRHRGIYEEAAKEKARIRAEQTERLDAVWDRLQKRHVGPGRSPQVGYTGKQQYGPTFGAYNPISKHEVN